MSKILVTGGAGFIGSHLAEALLERGHEVRVIDDLSTGDQRRFDGFASTARLEFIEGDLTDPDVNRDCWWTHHKLCEGIDTVFHLAAIPSVARSVEDPAASNEANVCGTLAMLVGARDAGVKRFIYASSSSVYGDTPTLPKIESMPPNPRSPYAAQKLLGETYCRLFWELYKLPTISLRYFNVFGPRQDPRSEYAAVIPRFITAMLEGRRPVVYGDGEQTRDFTPVADVVQANLQAMAAPAKAFGQAFNVAGGQQTSLNQLLRDLGNIVGCQPNADYQPARAGDVRHSLAGIGAARAVLGYEPWGEPAASLHRMFEVLADTVEWYRRQVAQ